MPRIPDQHQSQIAPLLDEARQLVRVGPIVVNVVTLPKMTQVNAGLILFVLWFLCDWRNMSLPGQTVLAYISSVPG